MNMVAKKADNDAEVLRQTMRECAADLFTAIELRAGVMDSESKVQAINSQRVDIMQAVAERLREA